MIIGQLMITWMNGLVLYNELERHSFSLISFGKSRTSCVWRSEISFMFWHEQMLLGYCNHYKSVTSHYEDKQKKKEQKYDWKLKTIEMYRHGWCTVYNVRQWNSPLKRERDWWGKWYRVIKDRKRNNNHVGRCEQENYDDPHENFFTLFLTKKCD